MMRRRVLQTLNTTAILFIAISSCASATIVRTLQVSPLTKKMLIVSLDAGENFSGSISISGGANNDIDFWITDPHGSVVLNLGRVKQGTSFQFYAQESGAYTLHFGNTFSWFSTKTVSLSFDVSYDIGSLTKAYGDFFWLVLGVIITSVFLGSVAFYYYRKSVPGTKVSSGVSEYKSDTRQVLEKGIFCAFCGTENIDEAIYCRKCGKKMRA